MFLIVGRHAPTTTATTKTPLQCHSHTWAWIFVTCIDNNDLILPIVADHYYSRDVRQSTVGRRNGLTGAFIMKMNDASTRFQLDGLPCATRAEKVYCWL